MDIVNTGNKQKIQNNKFQIKRSLNPSIYRNFPSFILFNSLCTMTLFGFQYFLELFEILAEECFRCCQDSHQLQL